ncbi:sulfurtransferase [Candidatus Methanoliparum sp. LAM-1]|uniref:sulfurtransferase n=1 Tax=Candidatus Methanoliparum sp. LAM-1 TaxID=2874846 RepID=UPI001E549B42|nr:sulfurtransferase [Candidatus Methanoliparum sp. LAM-1]BDC35956.1 sulfurtransferase [Candidatus Methanoliparum sp. LAM-1]
MKNIKYKAIFITSCFLTALFGSVFFVTGSSIDEKNSPYSANKEGIIKWVSTDWLLDHLNDDNLVVIDAQPTIWDYTKLHIPGAIYLNENIFRIHKGLSPSSYAPPESIEPIFQEMGLKNTDSIVVYSGKGGHSGKGDGLEQTHVAYCLARYGAKEVYVLDGGFEKWLEEGKPTTQKYGETRRSNFKVEDRSKEYTISIYELKKIKDNPNIVLIDARPKAVYEGQGPWSKPGHIPGAINLPWIELYDEDNPRLLKTSEEIEAILKENGVTPNKLIICSCGTSREATSEFIVLKWFLGYPNVRIYEGSFTEWTAYPDNPTETGLYPYK